MALSVFPLQAVSNATPETSTSQRHPVIPAILYNILRATIFIF